MPQDNSSSIFDYLIPKAYAQIDPVSGVVALAVVGVIGTMELVRRARNRAHCAKWTRVGNKCTEVTEYLDSLNLNQDSKIGISNYAEFEGMARELWAIESTADGIKCPDNREPAEQCVQDLNVRIRVQFNEGARLMNELTAPASASGQQGSGGASGTR